MKLELSEEERRLLLRCLREALEAIRYPMSPQAEALRQLIEKLRD